MFEAGTPGAIEGAGAAVIVYVALQLATKVIEKYGGRSNGNIASHGFGPLARQDAERIAVVEVQVKQIDTRTRDIEEHLTDIKVQLRALLTRIEQEEENRRRCGPKS